MVKLLPKDIESIVTFNDIREEFGNSEFMYIALGHEGSNAFNPELLKIVWEMSKSLEDYEPIEEVISIATANKIYFGQLDESYCYPLIIQTNEYSFLRAHQKDLL